MPRKVCGFRLDCGAMMLQPGLKPEECPNYTTCGMASELTPDEVFELHQARLEQQRQWERQQEIDRQNYLVRMERIRTTKRQLALEMLHHRANPQTVANYIPPERIDGLIEKIMQLQDQLQNLEGYIPPEGVIIHRYWVNRKYGRYPYNKLMAEGAIFPAVQRDKRETTRVVHLSKDDDLRNEEARKGLTRMHKLQQIRAKIQAAQEIIEQAIALTEEEIEPYWADREGETLSDNNS